MEFTEIKVTGRVQGVGFRWFTQKTATQLGVVGWVKNLSDGSVLLRAAAEASVMAEFKQRIAKGPPFSRVDHLMEHVLDETPGYTSFTVTY